MLTSGSANNSQPKYLIGISTNSPSLAIRAGITIGLMTMESVKEVLHISQLVSSTHRFKKKTAAVTHFQCDMMLHPDIATALAAKNIELAVPRI